MARNITEALRGLISGVPTSKEARRYNSREARTRAQVIANEAAVKAAMVGGGMAIVPGPFGILTIIPALVQIWHIQRQMVADIAACFGRTPQLSQEMMLYCLFRHGAANVFAETVIQVGGRLLVRKASLQVIQQLIQKISINVTQRMIGQFISRWLPFVGSAAIAAFTYRDTTNVAKTAIATFEKDFDFDVSSSIESSESFPAIKI